MPDAWNVLPDHRWINNCKRDVNVRCNDGVLDFISHPRHTLILGILSIVLHGFNSTLAIDHLNV